MQLMVNGWKLSMRHLLVGTFAIAAATVAFLDTPSASAQTPQQNFPQIEVNTPTGINLQTAEFIWQGADMQMGPLILDHYIGDIVLAPNTGLVATPFLTSLTGRLWVDNQSNSPQVVIQLGASRVRFALAADGSVFAMDSSAPGWKFAYSGTTSTLSYRNGDVYHFQGIGADWRSGRLSYKQAADGNRVEYFYDSSNRLNFVRSNQGYAISVNYAANKATVCGINLSITYAVQGHSCAGSSTSIEYSYDSSGYLTSIRDVRGFIRNISYANGAVSCITVPANPASATCEIQNQTSLTVQGERYVSRQIMADGRQYNISYSSGTESPIDYTPYFGEIRYSSTSVSDPDGRVTYARFGNGFLERSSDGEGNAAFYTYSLVNAFAILYQTGWSGPHYSSVFPNSVAYPEGNRIEFVRDDADNVTLRREIPKPGASDPVQTMSWVYPTTNPMHFQPFATRQMCCVINPPNLSTPAVP